MNEITVYLWYGKTYTETEVQQIIWPLMKQIEFLHASRIRCLTRLSDSVFAGVNGNLKFCDKEYELLTAFTELIDNAMKLI